MLAPLSKAEGEAAVAFVSESGGVGVDNTFFGKFGERVEDLVVRLEPPPPSPYAPRTLPQPCTLTRTLYRSLYLHSPAHPPHLHPHP